MLESVDIPKLIRGAIDMKDFDKSVTVIVTDLVHNGSVKTNLSALRTLVTDAFAKATPKAAVSLFAETSKFNGAFFPAMRDRKDEHLKSSLPYYIIVIGPTKQVSRFNKEFLVDAPTNQVHFGLTTPVNYSVLPNQNPKGVLWCSTEDPNCQSIEADMSDGPIEFELGLDLSNLPSSLHTQSVLAPLKVDAANASVSVVGGVKKISDNGSSNANDFTHTVRIRVDKLSSETTIMNVVLPPPSTPKWVNSLSLEDDNHPANQKPGTYKLNNIISGIQDAYNATYPNGLPSVFSLTIKIQKD